MVVGDVVTEAKTLQNAIQSNPVINTINLVNSIGKLSNLRGGLPGVQGVQYNMGINNINQLNALNGAINTINTINTMNQNISNQATGNPNEFTLKLIQNLTQLSNLKGKTGTVCNSMNPLNSGNFSMYSNNGNDDIIDNNKFTIHNFYKSANNTLNNFIQNNIMNSANSFSMLTNTIQPLQEKIKRAIDEEEPVEVGNVGPINNIQFKLEDDVINPFIFNNDGSRQTTRSFFKARPSELELAQMNKAYDERDLNQLAMINGIGGFVNNGNLQSNFEKFKTFCDAQPKSDKEGTSSVSPKRQFNVSPKSAFNKTNMFK
jgi:hypothetical protein